MVSSALYYHLAKWGYVLCDGRDHTPMQEAMGYREITRTEHEQLLASHAHAGGRLGPWVAEADLAAVAQWVSANKRPAAALQTKRSNAAEQGEAPLEAA